LILCFVNARQVSLLLVSLLTLSPWGRGEGEGEPILNTR
jgi:hypothetical protein